MHHVQGCAPFGVAVRLRQVSLNTQTVPLRWVPRTDGGPQPHPSRPLSGKRSPGPFSDLLHR